MSVSGETSHYSPFRLSFSLSIVLFLTKGQQNLETSKHLSIRLRIPLAIYPFPNSTTALLLLPFHYAQHRESPFLTHLQPPSPDTHPPIACSTRRPPPPEDTCCHNRPREALHLARGPTGHPIAHHVYCDLRPPRTAHWICSLDLRMPPISLLCLCPRARRCTTPPPTRIPSSAYLRYQNAQNRNASPRLHSRYPA